MGPSMNHHAGDFHIHITWISHNKSTKLQAADGQKLLRWGEEITERDIDNTSIFRKYFTVFTANGKKIIKLLMHGLPLVLKYRPHTLTSSWYQAPLAVGGVQTGLAATNFNVNFTGISPDDFLEEEDSLATIHNYSHSALIFTKLQLYEESDCQYFPP